MRTTARRRRASCSSVLLDGEAGVDHRAEAGTTRLDLFTGSDCMGALYNRTSGASTLHNINLGTVGIGNGTLSYRVSW